MATGRVPSRSRVAWWMLGAVLGLVVLLVVLEFLGTFVFGVFLYYSTRPVYRRIQSYVGPPSVAAAASLFLLALPALLLVGYVVAVSVSELRQLSDQVDLGPLGGVLGMLPDVSAIVASPEQLLTGGGVETLLGIVSSATAFLGVFGLVALHMFVMFAVAFYLLRDDYRLSTWVRTTFGDDTDTLVTYLDAVDGDLHSIFFGNILNAGITGTIGAIVYSLLNLFAPPGLSIPYAVLVGLLTGVASLIPIVGMKLVYVPVGAYLFARPLLTDLTGVLWFPVLFLVVSIVIVDVIPDLVLRPFISGRNLHVGMVMMAYVLGPLAFGWYGIFLAPLLLVLAFHFARIILPGLVAGEPLGHLATGQPTDQPTGADDSPAASANDGDSTSEQVIDGEDGESQPTAAETAPESRTDGSSAGERSAPDDGATGGDSPETDRDGS